MGKTRDFQVYLCIPVSALLEHSAVQSMVSRAKPVHKRPLEPKGEYYVTTDGTRYHIRHSTSFMTENSTHRGPSTGHTVKYTQGSCVCITVENYDSEIARLTSTLRPGEINSIKSASEAHCFHSLCPKAETLKRQSGRAMKQSRP